MGCAVPPWLDVWERLHLLLGFCNGHATVVGGTRRKAPVSQHSNGPCGHLYIMWLLLPSLACKRVLPAHGALARGAYGTLGGTLTCRFWGLGFWYASAPVPQGVGRPHTRTTHLVRIPGSRIDPFA